MNLNRFLLRISCWLIVLSIFAPTVWARELADSERIDFAREVLPVLSDKCFVCHGPDGTDRDVLQLDSFEAATRDLGGYRAIDPQLPEKSEMLKRILSTDDPMPPEDAEKQLTAGERDKLARWIRQGGQYAKHWSFIPPRKDLPGGTSEENKSGIIDAFLQSQLKARGMEFAEEADRATLARRAALVLTGLPPTPDRLAEFLADRRADAYQRFVEQLLASPHYGEHQARYWLDAVRYGDTHGLHLDNRRGIYPYRNWVIHALNENLPLDQFITWQIAGDLLPDPTLEQLVATGFVRMNPTTSEGGVIPAEFQAKNNFDRVETLGTVLLGMTLTCARCHSHKYDPVSQREYYQLMAFFNNTAESPLDGNKYEYGPVVKAPSSVAAWQDWKQLESQYERLLAAAAEQLQEREDNDPEVMQKWAKASDDERFTMLADGASGFPALDLQQEAIDLKERIAGLEASFATTLVARELPKPRETRVLSRGEYDLPVGEPLEANTFAVMGAFPADAPVNRLGLAQWLTSRDHPLVARVLVNRIWQRAFGEGLVRTSEDFGLQGQQPTHPPLLDWLAVELHDSGWDLKHLLRVIVNTRAFRQESVWRDDIDDPENRLFARGPRHRLDAEVIRDMALWASGLLDPHMGGEGVKPYQPPGLWAALMHPASNTKKYERDKGQKIYRRSLYVYWKRTCPHPMLTLFDAPSREASCVKRSRTNTSLQSLGLLNETQRIEVSRMLAQRLVHEEENDASRLDLLFTLLACRQPSDAERAACMKLLEFNRARYEGAVADAESLLQTGDAPRDKNIDVVLHAAWSQVVTTVLASDVAILLY
jgi:cytochrome c553